MRNHSQLVIPNTLYHKSMRSISGMQLHSSAWPQWSPIKRDNMWIHCNVVLLWYKAKYLWVIQASDTSQRCCSVISTSSTCSGPFVNHRSSWVIRTSFPLIMRFRISPVSRSKVQSYRPKRESSKQERDEATKDNTSNPYVRNHCPEPSGFSFHS